MRRILLSGVAGAALLLSVLGTATGISDGAAAGRRSRRRLRGHRRRRRTPDTTVAPTRPSPTAATRRATPPPTVADDGDVDSNDGGNRRQGNEPTVAIDPTNPNIVVAGWNDYCQTDLAAGWMGLGFSTDGGQTWMDSTLPGYPLDDSAEGSVSPLKGRTDAGDPLVAFDNDGRLFAGGIAFNRAMPQNGSVFVSTYGADPGPAGPTGQLPKDYLRTLIIDKAGTPAVSGIFQDKPMLEVDRSTASPFEDNVYFCWSKFQGLGRNKIYFARSTDHGAHLLARADRVRRQRPGL